MSYGSLSKNACWRSTAGRRRRFAHDTGEGGLSPYHLEPGGDLIWQVGTGYFSARTLDGSSRRALKENAARAQVKMID